MKYINNFIKTTFLTFSIIGNGLASESPKSWNQTENIVANGNFENGEKKPDSWKILKPRNGEIFTSAWDENIAFNGKRSIHLKVDTFKGRTISWNSKEFKVKPETTLNGQVAVKVKKIETLDRQVAGCIGLIHFFDKGGKYLRNRQIFFSPKEHNWKNFKFQTKVPKNAKKAVVVLGAIKAKGEFMFDNLHISLASEMNNPLENIMISTGKNNSEIPIIIPQPFLEQYDKDKFSWEYSKANIVATNHVPTAINALKKGLIALGVTNITSDSSLLTTPKYPIFIFSNINSLDKSTIKNTFSSKIDLKKSQSYLLKVELKNNIPTFHVYASSHGAFNATQTILQYIAQSKSVKNGVYTGIIYDKPAFKNRGLISGSHSSKRLDMMEKHKMNLILLVGSPHCTAWFKGLSNNEKKQHKKFLQECKSRFITPVPSIHPGYIRKNSDGTTVGKLLKFSDNKLFEGMITHFKDLYDLGFRTFSIAWDDMGRHGGQNKLIFKEDQVKFKSIAEAHRLYTERVYQYLKSIDPKITLWTIGMSYWLDGSEFDKIYLTEFGKLSKEIKFMSCGTMDSKSMNYHHSLTGRNAVIWDNSAGNLNSTFIEPLIIDYKRNTESLTDTYMFPMHDKKMIWDLVSDYLWCGKDLKPKSSAKRSISVIIGAEFADIIQKTAETVNKLKRSPVPGNTSQEKINSLNKKMKNLQKFKKNLVKKVDAKIATPFIKEIKTLEKEAKIYQIELKKRPLPVLIGKFSNPPKIDGNLNEPVWQNSAKFNNFRLIMRNKQKATLATVQTVAYIGWDNKNLYVAFQCSEPNIPKMKSYVKKRDEAVFQDDCVELFLDIERNANTYYHIAVNSIGTIYDYHVNKEPWNGDIMIETKKEDKQWTVEMAISFSSLNVKPVIGDIWNFNLCRERYVDKPEFSSWSLLMKRFLEPRHFWTLKFAEKAGINNEH